ncbi:MerR family transcriptional regulator [Streptomyces canus]|uniref:MerR family transcriptional regulator n=1 Tax=Streptomyces canus TaxID=58343 RepID=UPI00036D5392|nr:MerR family transcriptional regulator [Streptomyces canus]
MTARDAVGIREVSEQTGLSVDTLRWYERQGLLPVVGRRADGRRRYSAYAVGFVKLVQVLRRTGMPVAEVREFVRLGDGGLARHASRLAMLERHAAVIEERMAQLQADYAAVQDQAAQYRDMIAHGQDCEDRLAEQQGAESLRRR